MTRRASASAAASASPASTSTASAALGAIGLSAVLVLGAAAPATGLVGPPVAPAAELDTGLRAAEPASARPVVGVDGRPYADVGPVRDRSWAWPVSPVRIAVPYRAPETPYAAGHRGIDLVAAPGDEVVAAEAGVVSYRGRVVDRPVLTIDHGNGVLSSIEPVASELPVGAIVERGAPVGVVDAGGHCDGACVHFGVRVDGDYVSPLRFLGGVPRAVLLPEGG